MKLEEAISAIAGADGPMLATTYYEAVSAILFAVRSGTLIPAPQWQPMSSAPKYGTRILLWLREPFSCPMLAVWCEPWRNWVREMPTKDEMENGEIYGAGRNVPIGWQPIIPPTINSTKEPTNE